MPTEHYRGMALKVFNVAYIWKCPLIEAYQKASDVANVDGFLSIIHLKLI